MDSLNNQQRAMLDFERLWWATTGSKETEIAERFAMSPVRYYQRLNRVLAAPAALAYDPVTVNRLRRISAPRRRGRAS